MIFLRKIALSWRLGRGIRKEADGKLALALAIHQEVIARCLHPRHRLTDVDLMFAVCRGLRLASEIGDEGQVSGLRSLKASLLLDPHMQRAATRFDAEN